VNVQHDPGRILTVLIEETLQHVHHELHRGIIVVQKENAVKVRPFRARFGFCDEACVRAATIIASRGL
jgi:hypothetical protein